MFLPMGHCVKMQGYTDVWGEFAFIFLQNYTVKIFFLLFIRTIIISIIFRVTVNRNQFEE